MKKKMYNQPQVQVTEMEPQTVLCASLTQGPPAPGGVEGD